MVTKRALAAMAVIAAGMAGCKGDQGFVPSFSGSIAVTAGDFDDVAAPFERMVIQHEVYEGLISAATWDPSFEPANVALKVESLLGDGQEIDNHGAVFIASGTRGLGLRQYNGLDPDDQFVNDAYVIEQIQAYASRPGNVLVCTDWAYDLVEQAFPDQLEFLGDDTVFDGAQAGEIGDISAKVEDQRLADAIGQDTMAVRFDFSNWAVIEATDDNDVTVWLRADEVQYRIRDGEGTRPIQDVPLLVSFAPNGSDGGRVVFSSFHIDAQTPEVVDELLRTVVGDFDEAGEEPVAPIQ